jgi:hypothetical protein
MTLAPWLVLRLQDSEQPGDRLSLHVERRAWWGGGNTADTNVDDRDNRLARQPECLQIQGMRQSWQAFRGLRDRAGDDRASAE